MPKPGTWITTELYGDGVVVEVYASSFIYRVYDKGDHEIYANDEWSAL